VDLLDGSGKDERVIRSRGLGCLIVPGLLALGCAGSDASIRLDPDAFGNDQGTLISIEDVRVVAEEMIRSMNESGALARLRATSKPVRILVGDLKQRTSITLFDKQVFMNRLLGRLTAADLDGFYTFIRREPVIEEGVLQEEGRATTSPGLGELTGAEHVLSGEVREILHRESLPDGGELEKRTVQYTLALDRVADGARLWIHTHEIVKEQVTGAVYS
jgi:peptidoglycan-synthase activator LpoB